MAAALVESWSLQSRRAQAHLFKKVALIITYTQERNLKSEKAHILKTKRRLREAGIKLSTLPTCCWTAEGRKIAL